MTKDLGMYVCVRVIDTHMYIHTYIYIYIYIYMICTSFSSACVCVCVCICACLCICMCTVNHQKVGNRNRDKYCWDSLYIITPTD